DIADKVAFDPTREKRKVLYPEVLEIFGEQYTVFIGGSSSFDFSEKRFNKYDAIMQYAKENGYEKDEILYVGDDFGDGGGDSHVRLGGMDYIFIDDYRTLPEKLAHL
ncbi:MAG: HAD hydrolase family protein, partial [Clostridia bacterium]|nr:HAD hydrolase family protein [Clostridia bacterium]